VVQLATHRPKASLDIAKALAISQLSEGHRQILVAAREASVVSVTAIARDTLLKLVGGQVVHQLSEDRLTEIHSSLSEIVSAGAEAVSGSFPREKIQIEKTDITGSLMIPWALCRRRKF
jgi:hypothetical protein